MSSSFSPPPPHEVMAKTLEENSCPDPLISKPRNESTRASYAKLCESRASHSLGWVSWRIFQFVVIRTAKGIGIVNKAEVDVFLELSYFFDDPTDVGNLISGSSAFSKSSLNILKFMVHKLLKPGLENFEHYFARVWDECNCVVVWAFFGITFLWDWDEKWPFPVLWPLLCFPNLLAYWVQHFHSIIF